MPICEICGEEEKTVTKCKICDARFCEYCGSTEDKKCIECLELRDDEADENWLRAIS
jgi:hypothetical protein